MSERDLVDELKANIKDLQDEKADMAKTIEGKERRIKQILIKLEHATKDVQSTGHKIGEQNKEITELKAKLETKSKLLDEALQKIKDIHDDSTQEKDPDTEDKDLD